MCTLPGSVMPPSTVDDRHAVSSAAGGAYRRGILEFSAEGATMKMTEDDFVRRRVGQLSGVFYNDFAVCDTQLWVVVTFFLMISLLACLLHTYTYTCRSDSHRIWELPTWFG